MDGTSLNEPLISCISEALKTQTESRWFHEPQLTELFHVRIEIGNETRNRLVIGSTLHHLSEMVLHVGLRPV